MLACLLLPWLHAHRVHARASDIELRWAAPPSCPQRQALQSGLEQRLGHAVRFGDDAPVTLTGTIESMGDGYTLELATHTRDGDEQRKLQARGCNELARASVLVAALLLSDTSSNEPRGPLHGSLPSGRGPSLDFYGRALLTLDFGTLPAFAFGPALALGVQIEATRLELGALYLPPRDAPSSGSALATLQLWAARAGVCQALSRSPVLAPCLQAEFGQLSGRGLHLRSNATASVTWALFSAGLTLAVELGAGFSWHSEFSLGITGNRARFAVRDLGTLHQVPTLVGRISTGLALRF